jgi:NADH-quinone oxidoreductase subunit I
MTGVGFTTVARDYLLPIVKGLGITFRHLAESVLQPSSRATIEYPEMRRRYSPRFRGVHKLTTREDGSTRCVACMLCATVCPAYCIHIEAGEHPDPKIEKYPVRFEIDLLRCVYCGFCVDACPCEAIVMTQEYEMAQPTREATVIDKEHLIQRDALGRFGLGYRPRP